MQKGLAIFLGAWLASSLGVRADVFTINPAQSVITLSGTAAGAPIIAQPPSGLSTSYSGFIDVTLSPGSIQFNSASANAMVSGTYTPGVGGGAGTAPGDYGGAFTVSGFPGVFSIRDFLGSLTSGAISLTGGAFNASQLLFSGTGGNVDYSVFIFSGSLPATGESATNMGGMGSIAIVNGVQTLTIPIDVTLVFTAVNTDDTVLRFTGNLVATAIPEPATYMLFGVGLLFCAQRFRRAKRK